MEFINFGYDWQQKNIEIDLNDHRTQAHLKALIRGSGSTTESIVVDFVMERTDHISSYESIQEAWSRLDAGQQHIVAGLRSLMSRPCLCDVSSPHFPQLWFRRLVANEFLQLRDQYEADRDVERVPIEHQAELAQTAEQTVRGQVTSTDLSATWVIDTDDD